jgi:AraC-like DNA-binding protein
MITDRRLKLVSADDLGRLAGQSSSDFRVITSEVDGSKPLLIGEFKKIQLRAGLTLHITNTREIHDLRTEATQRPSLTVSLFLKGHIKAWFGGRPMKLGAGSNIDTPDIEAVAVACSQPDRFVRQSVKGTHIRKINVTITPEWLGDVAMDNKRSTLSRFLYDHLSMLRWKASPRLIGLAEQLLSPPHLINPLQNLYYESRAIDVISEALQVIGDTPAHSDHIAGHAEYVRLMQRACAHIDAHLDQELTVQSIANAAGVNSVILQRAFRADQGVSIFEYVRRRRLDYAREALERDDISVGEAAYMVGYKSPCNFSTAFRRRFGISPRQIRTRY